MANNKKKKVYTEYYLLILPPLIIICFGIALALMLYYFNQNNKHMDMIEHNPNMYFGISNSSGLYNIFQ